jgi:phage terminase large subunit-like protein
VSELRPSLGGQVVSWIETFLVHGPGDVQGKPIHLDDEFAAFLWRCYEIWPAGYPLEGQRYFRRAMLSRPKGRAKSELAGMLCCVEFLGPARFDHWAKRGETSWWGYEFEPGEPVGEGVTNPIIRCFATEENQAGNTFSNALFMLEEGAVADAYGPIDTGLTRINHPERGFIISTTSAAGSKDGGLDTFACFDEVHLWTSTRLKALHATVTRNLRKRWNCWVLETSTMYCPGEGSVAEETHRADAELPHVLFDHKQAPLDVDIKDDEQLLAALRYVYGPAAEWMDLRGIMEDEFRDPTKRESDSRRYWLNQPWSAEEKFTFPHLWDACEHEDPAYEIPRAERVVLGFDGSFSDDSTALVACTVADKPHLQLVGMWERPEGVHQETWRVSRADVMETIRQACKRWRVLACAADPYGWAQSLEELLEEGIPVEEFPQGTRMFPASKRLHDMIAEGEITWSDPTSDGAFRRHMLNANVKHDSRGIRIVKDDSRRDLKVDAAVAAAIALATAANVVDATPNVWSIREVVEELRREQAPEPSHSDTLPARPVRRIIRTPAGPVSQPLH